MYILLDMTNAANANSATKTFRFEIEVLGRWHVSARGVSAVETQTYIHKYANDPTVRIVAER